MSKKNKPPALSGTDVIGQKAYQNNNGASAPSIVIGTELTPVRTPRTDNLGRTTIDSSIDRKQTATFFNGKGQNQAVPLKKLIKASERINKK